MRRYLALPIVSLCVLLAGPPAFAQTSQERTMYEPMQGDAIREYKMESEVMDGLRTKLSGETDLVKGCGLLDQNVAQLKKLEKVLDNLVLYDTKLRQVKERKAAEAQRTAVQEEITLRQGDITRLCASVSAPST